MTHIRDDNYPLEFEVRVSTDHLTALRIVNRLSKGVAKDDKHMRKIFKDLRDLEHRIENKLLLGKEAA